MIETATGFDSLSVKAESSRSLPPPPPLKLRKYMAFLTVEPMAKFHENLEVCEFPQRGRECFIVKP